MPTYIQSFEDAKWCVNNESRIVSGGEIVAFEQPDEAGHFVTHGRAVLIGDFASDEEALGRLQQMVAEVQAAQQSAEPPAASAVAEPAVEAPKPVKAKKGK